MPSTTTYVQHTINRLRAIADLLLINHDFFVAHSYDEVMDGQDWDDRDKFTYMTYYASGGGLSISVMGPEAKELMRDLRRRLRPGQWRKYVSGETFRITTPYEADQPSIDITASRDTVCVKRVVGTELREIPAVEAQPARTETVEKVEWDCGNLLDDTDPNETHLTVDDDEPADFDELVGDEMEC